MLDLIKEEKSYSIFGYGSLVHVLVFGFRPGVGNSRKSYAEKHHSSVSNSMMDEKRDIQIIPLQAQRSLCI